MKKNIIFLLLNFFLLFSCKNIENTTNMSNISSTQSISIHNKPYSDYISSTQSISIYNKSYSDYKSCIIPLNDMFEQEDNLYGVYFYSEYCPACASLKENLFKYLDISNKCIDNLYLVDIGNTSLEDFSKLKSGNGLYDEEIISNTINATCIEETYFRTSPCLYIIEKINNVNTIKDFYLNYQDVYNFLINNSLNKNT